MSMSGITPKKQVMDNEASTLFKQEIMDTGMTYQKVPPDDHHRNLAEKGIQTWKDNFVAVCNGTADTCSHAHVVPYATSGR